MGLQLREQFDVPVPYHLQKGRSECCKTSEILQQSTRGSQYSEVCLLTKWPVPAAFFVFQW